MESELIVHWGRRCCTASCSRIVHVRALLPCPVRSKLTSSGKRALQAARTWGLRVAGFGASIPIPRGECAHPQSSDWETVWGVGGAQHKHDAQSFFPYLG